MKTFSTTVLNRRRVLKLAGAVAFGGLTAACAGGTAGGGAPLSDVLPVGKEPVVKDERVELRRRLKPAPGLPEKEPDVRGLYVRRDDNTLFVGTGNVRLGVEIDSNVNNGQPRVKADYDGPVKEILIGRDTVFYRDITPANVEAMKKGEEIQQQVEPVATSEELLKDISTNDTLSAWGTMRGERLAVTVLVVARPALPDAPQR